MLPLLLLLALPQDLELAETVITAPRAAATVTTTSARVTEVSGEALRETGERSLPRALGQAAGLWIQETNLGGGQPVIRGFLGNKILVLVDGVRLNDSTTRLGPNPSLNQIDPEIVERIEVIRGPSSVLYGSDAIGGVISIWTRRRPAASQDPDEHLRPWDGEFVGLWDTSIEGGRATLHLDGAWGDHGALAVGTTRDLGDLKVADDVVVPNTGYSGFALFGSYEYALGRRQTLRLTGRVSRDFDVPRTDRMNTGYGQTQPAARDWRYTLQDRRGYLVSYTDERPGALAERMQLRVALHGTDETRDITSADGSTRSQSRDEVVTFSVGADWRTALSEDHLLTWGLDASLDDVDSVRRETDAGGTSEVAGNYAPDASYARYGFFVQDEILTFDPWFLTAGLRLSIFDWSFGTFGSNASYSEYDSALTGSLEAVRDLGDGLTLFGSVAQGFRAPGLEDLANDGDFAGGLEIANPDLEAERSLSVEGGLTYVGASRSGSVTAFATRIEDAIGRRLLDEGDPAVDGDELYQRTNTGRVDVLGLEAAHRQRLGEEGSPYELYARATYTLGREDDDAYGGSVPARRVPPLYGTLGLDYRPEEPVWSYLPNARAFVDWALVQDRLHPQDESDPRIDPSGTDGWTTWNLEVWGEFERDIRWNLALLNLLDESYRVHGSGVDGPGRRLVLGVSVTF
jgi:outer membrane receptor protein involved in Fe transport